MDIQEYEEAFNVGDDAALIERFYCKDLIYTIDGRSGHGSQGLLDFFIFAHDGVREIMRVQSAVNNGDTMFADIDMDFHATKRRDDFPLGALAAGDSITVKMFAKYVLREGKIAELSVMQWPVGVGVSRLPRLGASHPTQRAAFESLCAALTAGDVDRVVAFCTPEVTLSDSQNLPAVGVDAVAVALKEVFDQATVEAVSPTVQLHDGSIELTMSVTEALPGTCFGDGSGGVFDGVVTLADGLIDSVVVRRVDVCAGLEDG